MRGLNRGAVWLTQPALNSCKNTELETKREAWKDNRGENQEVSDHQVLHRCPTVALFFRLPLAIQHSSFCPRPGRGPWSNQKPSVSSLALQWEASILLTYTLTHTTQSQTCRWPVPSSTARSKLTETVVCHSIVFPRCGHCARPKFFRGVTFRIWFG